MQLNDTAVDFISSRPPSHDTLQLLKECRINDLLFCLNACKEGEGNLVTSCPQKLKGQIVVSTSIEDKDIGRNGTN